MQSIRWINCSDDYLWNFALPAAETLVKLSALFGFLRFILMSRHFSLRILYLFARLDDVAKFTGLLLVSQLIRDQSSVSY